MSKTIVFGAIATVAVGGAILVGRRCCHKRDDDDEAQLATLRPTSQPSATARGEVDVARRAATTIGGAASPPTTTDTMETMHSQSTTFMQDYSFSAGDGSAGDAGGQESVNAQGMTVPDAHGVVHFPQLGLHWKLASGWIAHEDAAPVPNVAMVQLAKMEYIERIQQQGMQAQMMAPVVLIGVEDLSNEGLDMDEFRQRTEQVTKQQLLMMTGGHFQPTVVFDGPLSIGPFTHSMEFQLKTPFAEMRMLNAMTLVNGIAYCMRVMAADADFRAVKHDATTMMRDARIEPLPVKEPFTRWSYLDLTTTRARVHIPTNWCEAGTATVNASTLFALKTTSSTRPEDFIIYETEALERVADVATWRPNGEPTTADGVTVTKYKDRSNIDRRVAKAGTTVLVAASPAGIVTSDDVLRAVVRSVRVVAADGLRVRFTCERMGCAFDMEASGRILESRIAERTATYIPSGAMSPDGSQDGPMLTLRVGDPSNDTDCRATLDEWMARIESESEGADGSIQDLKREKVNGRDCVTFVNKDMVEVGPSQREERYAKVIIFLVGIKTIMLRWEAASGVFQRSQRRLKSLLDSFTMS